MGETLRYRVTFRRKSPEIGFDEKLGNTISSLKQQLKDYADCTDCIFYDQPSNVHKTNQGTILVHGVQDVEKSYPTVNDFLNDSSLDDN
jgi:hypothetical protein